MKKLISWLVFAVVAFYASAYLLNHLPQIEQSVAQSSAQKPAQTEGAVTYVGPLADYAQGEAATGSKSKSATPWNADASDMVRDDSPAGTGGVILHKTFALAQTAKFPFEIPAHATNPQLRGNYRSFLRQENDGSSDDAANVEFLLMNEQQYADFQRGRQADVLFFVQSSHSQQVNFGLPPTFDRPARYCLVFRNRSTGAAEKNGIRKIVQADFSVEF